MTHSPDDPTVHLRVGASGPAVRDLHHRLSQAGHPAGGGDHVRSTPPRPRCAPSRRPAVSRRDGVCGPQTWSALVEAGFRLGDRLLYHRRPMLRGDDVGDAPAPAVRARLRHRAGRQHLRPRHRGGTARLPAQRRHHHRRGLRPRHPRRAPAARQPHRRPRHRRRAPPDRGAAPTRLGLPARPIGRGRRDRRAPRPRRRGRAPAWARSAPDRS